MSPPHKVRHWCLRRGRQEWLARRPGGRAWVYEHRRPGVFESCRGGLVPVTESRI